ncbi:MAG: Trm112 family protein, partial [Burkholderiaceae bacterium]
HEFWSRSARLAYPIRDGIPVLLEAEARPLSDEELASLPDRAPLAGS